MHNPFQEIIMNKLVTGLFIQIIWVKIILKVVIDVNQSSQTDVTTRMNWMINLIILWIMSMINMVVMLKRMRIINKRRGIKDLDHLVNAVN